MRRGRIFLYLALILILLLVVGYLWWMRQNQAQPSAPSAQPTPAIRTIEIVVAGQNIYPGRPITEDMLATIPIPESQLVAGEFTNKADVVGKYPRIAIAQGVPIMDTMLSSEPGNVNLPGSTWAPYIPNGYTAIAIPITRLTSVGYGIRDGDYVNVIVTMLLVDVDAAYQTFLPNVPAGIMAANSRGLLIGSGTGQDATTQLTQGEIINLTAQSVRAGEGGPIGRVQFDEDLQQPFYVVPSETQRPRLVSQMILQNVQVLHVGTFPLPGQEVSSQLVAPPPGTTPTPAPQNQEQQTTTIERPDIVTLMVPNQDAVTLTWLIYSGAKITLTLRSPNDKMVYEPMYAATLEYLLTQYNVTLPPKLPYALEPRVDELLEPCLPNDDDRTNAINCGQQVRR